MKKFFKLCLAVAALATMFGFASCSNDSSNDSTTTPAATKTVKTTTVKIGDTEYSYTETDGKVDTSDKIKVADDGSITVTVADGSKVTISKDGKTITYTDKNGKVYTGQTGGESITLKSEDGKEITATVSSKTEPSANAAPAAGNVFKGKTFVSPDGMSLIFGSDGNLTAAVKVDEKFNITKQAYTVNGNAFSATIGKMNASGTLSGTTLTAGDGDPKHVGTFAQTSGSNEFAGKSFITADGTKLVVVVSDSSLLMLGTGSKEAKETSYTVEGGKVSGKGFEATLSGKTLSIKVTAKDGEHTDTGTLIE